jgi:3-hydroxybutyryl-CoA dehydrogenase
MPFDANRDGLILGVAGGGAMGRGIAQVAVVGGITTRIYDATRAIAEDAQEFIARMLDRQVEKNAMPADEAAAAKARLAIASSLDELADCNIVIEAIIEDLGIKQQLFRDLEAIVRPDVPLVSNTSSLRIASMAAVCEHRGRVAGMHFFNPVPLMKLVEIIAAPDTDPAVAEALSTLGRRMGRTPVHVKDGPGFLVNLGGRAYTTEGLKLTHERVATPAQIDAVMRDCCGFRMGPFELMDLTGMDVNFPASMAIYDGYFHG